MEPVRLVSGPVSVLDRADVDTDQIIPKQFLKRVERTGFGEFLFHDWAQARARLGPPGQPRSSPPGRTSAAARAASTRRGRCRTTASAPSWRASFADIFFSNCTKIGLLPVVLPEEDVRALMEAGEGGGRPRGPGGPLRGPGRPVRARRRAPPPAARGPRRHRHHAQGRGRDRGLRGRARAGRSGDNGAVSVDFGGARSRGAAGRSHPSARDHAGRELGRLVQARPERERERQPPEASCAWRSW